MDDLSDGGGAEAVRRVSERRRRRGLRRGIARRASAWGSVGFKWISVLLSTWLCRVGEESLPPQMLRWLSTWRCRAVEETSLPWEILTCCWPDRVKNNQVLTCSEFVRALHITVYRVHPSGSQLVDTYSISTKWSTLLQFNMCTFLYTVIGSTSRVVVT